MYPVFHFRWTMAIASLLVGSVASAQSPAHAAPFDSATAKDRHALQVFLGTVEKDIVSAAEAMPADKYGFAPTEGEFHGVRSFRMQLKHLAATNYILAAAALGQDPPADAGDEAGPDAVNTKEDVLSYLRGSFAALGNAIALVGNGTVPVRSSPISPLQGESATRLALIVEALIHSFDHYGQMVVYLRMNGIVPPASRR
jgi:uncharacterized damage-inducible protein DinB